MKAITLWQPWASLCVLPRPMFDYPLNRQMCEQVGHRRDEQGVCGNCADGLQPTAFKTIETRSWPAPNALIGQRIAIHAAKRKPDVLTIGPWPLGAIVGTAVLTDCVPMVAPDDEMRDYRRLVVGSALTLADGAVAGSSIRDVSDQLPFGDFAPGRWAWLLADAEQFAEPIPARGGQRIWNWDGAA